jgi:hypothetical protein
MHWLSLRVTYLWREYISIASKTKEVVNLSNLGWFNEQDTFVENRIYHLFIIDFVLALSSILALSLSSKYFNVFFRKIHKMHYPPKMVEPKN